MRAVQYETVGATPTLVDVPEPSCPDDGVVIAVAATGVCRSDWHAWVGHDPVPLPMIPGHELAGTVVEVGPQVRDWQAGARVVVPFACGCGRPGCAQCATGDTHVCPDQTQPGFTGWGSFAERVVIHAAATNLVALPDAIGFVEAAALGCRFATAYRAVVSQARLAKGEWLAVHGCGGVGLSAVMIGVALGARVVAVDVSEAALAAARELGAVETVLVDGAEADAGAEQVARAVRGATGGGGADVSVDALGSAATMTASVLGLRPQGRHVQVGLMLDEAAQAPFPWGAVVGREVEVLGGHGMPARDYPDMLALVASGVLDPRRLVGRVIPLEEAGAALAAMSEPATGAGVTVVELA